MRHRRGCALSPAPDGWRGVEWVSLWVTVSLADDKASARPSPQETAYLRGLQ